jgi:hypothetical protein
MSDYRKAASDMKARWNASAAKTAHLMAFFDSLRLSLSREVKRANSALTSEDLPEIELKDEGSIELTYVGAKCKIHIVSDLNMIHASYVSRSGDGSIRLSVLEKSDPPVASITEISEFCGQIGPQEAAVAIIEKLLEVAP